MRWSSFWILYAAALAALLAFAALAAEWATGAQHRDRDARTCARLERQSQALAAACATALALDPQARSELLAPLADAAQARLTLIEAGGVVLFDSEHEARTLENHASRPEVQAALSQGLAQAQRVSATSGRESLYVARAVTSADGRRGVLRLGQPAARALGSTDAAAAALRGAALIGAGAMLAFGLALARRMREPLAATADLAEAIARGDYRRAHAPHGAPELRRLSEAIATMTAQLEHRLEMMTVDRNKVLAILSSLVEGVVAVDQSERVVHINTVAAKLLDVDPASALGRRIWEVVRVSAVHELLERARRSGAPCSGQCELAADADNPSGAVLELRAAPLRDGTGAVLVLHDLTALRKLENIRRDFVANVSHELKTPLTAIRGLVETVLDDEQMPAPIARRFLGKIRDQSARLTALVSDLLTLARVESGAVAPERRTLDARLVVRECAARAATACEHKRLQFSARIPAAPVWAWADDESLREIVDNLLDNACKYTPAGGSVSLGLTHTGANLEISVRDSGIGIDPRDCERVFERFYRVDKARSRELGGTGLGLSIVKHLAQSLGGAVSLASELGGGSHFRVSLPSAPQPAEHGAEGAEDSAP